MAVLWEENNKLVVLYIEIVPCRNSRRIKGIVVALDIIRLGKLAKGSKPITSLPEIGTWISI